MNRKAAIGSMMALPYMLFAGIASAGGPNYTYVPISYDSLHRAIP
jgi:hypothetical protein